MILKTLFETCELDKKDHSAFQHMVLCHSEFIPISCKTPEDAFFDNWTLAQSFCLMVFHNDTTYLRTRCLQCRIFSFRVVFANGLMRANKGVESFPFLCISHFTRLLKSLMFRRYRMVCSEQRHMNDIWWTIVINQSWMLKIIRCVLQESLMENSK